LPKWKATRGEKSKAYRRIQVCARNIADCVNHGEHDQTEGECDPDVRNCAAGRFIDHNRAGAGEDESKRPDKFRRELHV
jgi:hypothetical protein